MNVIHGSVLPVISLPSSECEWRLLRRSVVLLEMESGKVKPVLPSCALAAFGDGALVYALAIHKPFLTFSLDKADLCCPQENMPV